MAVETGQQFELKKPFYGHSKVTHLFGKFYPKGIYYCVYLYQIYG